MIREPETADPARNPAQARANQTDTLKAMQRDKKITAAQASRRRGRPFFLLRGLPLSGDAFSTRPGTPTSSRPCARNSTPSTAAIVDSGGLRVTTTLDPTLQAEAYNAVYGNNSTP